MNDEVHDAYNKGCVNERRNVLNNKASPQKVNVIKEEGKYPKDDGIHNEDADTERENDDGTENKRENRFQNAVQKRKDERNER